ncbi:alpha/beta fold hydrolase [Halapricum hydrolyticum]|uniref:alpha/beta fold hydrolase n=1 Tax=Halapricum hydrolyticum TaxID=2979991 RepID=UPI0028F74EB8|nr:alpha/beta hydrolase [Halapricum hydrolyticum]
MKREDYEYGSYGSEDLEEVSRPVQTSPLELLERQAEGMLKEPPSRELRNLILDEGSRSPASIQGAALFGLLFLRDYRNVLSEIDVPTLVCAGADETWHSGESVKYVAELVSNAQFEIFENSGHCPMLEEPERFNRVLGNFIDGL